MLPPGPGGREILELLALAAAGERCFETFGRIHEKLVDTIFRYNRRHLKGRYIEALQRKGVRGDRRFPQEVAKGSALS